MGDFTYTQATNTVVVINGTSGTPKTFADFVTDDRAGSLTLLSAGVIDADPDTFSLTTQPRPCEKGVIALTISASADRAGATLEIVGKDYDSDAIGETIDIATANATPVTSVLKYNTVDASGITVNGMTNDDTITITQPQWGVIWDYTGRCYRVDARFNIGNGTTATYFATEREVVMISQTYELQVTANAVLKSGKKVSTDSVDVPSVFAFRHENNTVQFTDNLTQAGTLLLYGSYFIDLTVAARTQGYRSISWDISNSASEIYHCMFIGPDQIAAKTGSPTFYDNKFFSGNNGYRVLSGTPSTLYSQNRNCYRGTAVSALSSAVEVRGTTFADNATDLDMINVNYNFTLVDAEYTTIGGPGAASTANTYDKKSCNITVTDKNGTLLDGVEVLCEDTDDAIVFTTTTGDTDTGKIDEQLITYIDYYYSGGAQADTMSPHKFTLSKAGYETLILENVTVDAPIAWHLELKGPVRYKLGSDTFFEDDS